MKCVLIGNYGAGNVGDEALREYFLRTFSEISWMVLSSDPTASNEVPRVPTGFRSFFRPWWRTLAAFWHADAVVFGGGSLFTDSESAFACVLWGWHAFVARVLGKPTLFAFQGVGPFRSSFAEGIARAAFLRATFISVRDEKSLQRVQSWHPKFSPILTFDPAFSLFKSFQSSFPTSRSLAIIPRGNSDEQFFVTVGGELVKSWDAVHILLMQPDEAERGVAVRISAMSGGKATITAITTVDQLLSEIAKASTVVTQRYHGALAALALGKRTVICVQQKGDKLDALSEVMSDSHEPLRWQELIRTGAEELSTALNLHSKSSTAPSVSVL